MASRRMIALGGGSGTASFPLLATDGTQAAPSYSFSSSASTGMYISGTSVLFSCGNSPGFRINSTYCETGTGLGIGATAGSSDAFVFRVGANNLSIGRIANPADNILTLVGANAGQANYGTASELLTLSTVGTTTDTVANLLPAGAIILGVTARVTTTITTATSWALGDATTAARFAAANATMTAGTTAVGLDHWAGTVAIRQSAAAKVRVTTVGTPGAGAIRITVNYASFSAPTS